MAYRTADTVEHVDLHIGNVDLAGLPLPHPLSGRPLPNDRPFGSIEPRYRWSDDLDGKHRSTPTTHPIKFQSTLVMENDDGVAIVQENTYHIETDS